MNLNRISFLGSAMGLTLLGILSPSESATASPSTPQHHDSSAAMHSTMSPVIAPAVPESVTFAGKKISLDDIDMWERLDREGSRP